VERALCSRRVRTPLRMAASREKGCGHDAPGTPSATGKGNQKNHI
jgi:hypothetical protein